MRWMHEKWKMKMSSLYLHPSSVSLLFFFQLGCSERCRETGTMTMGVIWAAVPTSSMHIYSGEDGFLLSGQDRWLNTGSRVWSCIKFNGWKGGSRDCLNISVTVLLEINLRWLQFLQIVQNREIRENIHHANFTTYTVKQMEISPFLYL